MATKTYNIDINVQSKTLGQLEDQLSEINEELKQVDRNSQAFKDLSKQAQATEKELAKVNKQIEGFTAEDKFMAADGAIKAFSGALQGAVGVMGMFGIEAEVFGEFEKKAASAIALGIGLKDISEGYGQLSKSFKAATGAQLGFNTATLLNPYIAAGAAIVAVIGAIVVQFDKFSKVLEDAGLGTLDLSGAWVKFQDFFAGATTAIAKSAGKLVAGMAALFRLDFKEAGKQLGGINVKEDFNEGVITRRTERIQDQAKKDAESYELTRQEELKRLQAEWAFEDELAEATSEFSDYWAEEGKKSAMSFQEAFTTQMNGGEDEDPFQFMPEFVDTDFLDDMEDLDESLAKYRDDQEKALQLDELRRQSRLQLLDVIEGATNQETAIGKAAFIARQAIIISEIGLEAKKMAIDAQMAATGAAVDANAGLVKTIASAPFPLNVALGAAYLVQVGSILASVKDAVSAAGGTAAGVAVTPPSAPAIPQEMSTAPDIGPAQPMVQAYVVAGDTRSADEAQAKIQTRRTFGS